jgi:hypothetical protein
MGLVPFPIFLRSAAMSDIIVDMDGLVRELRMVLEPLNKAKPVLIVDEGYTNADDHDEIHLLVKLGPIAEPVVLIDHIDFSLLPQTMMPAMPLQKWWLDEESRWLRVANALNESLRQVKVQCTTPDESELRQLPLDAVRSSADLDMLTFRALITEPNGGYVSFTDEIFFGEMAKRAQMDAIWARIAREETWHDRKLIF